MKKITSTLSLLLFFCSITFAIDFRGIIKDEITQKPIAGAMVRVFKNTDQVASTKTDEDGNFNIPLLMGMDYKVYIDKNDYEQLRVSITTNFSASITELPSLDLLMVRRKTNTEISPVVVSLTGKLYHLQLGGIEGEQISAKNNSTGTITSAITQPNGNYTLALAPNKNYTIMVTSNGTSPEYEYAPVYLNTSGINSSIQIIRNFENRGIITKEDTKLIDITEKTAIVKESESINNKTDKAPIKKADSIKDPAPILSDKDKALVNSLNSKYEKLKMEDSIGKTKDKMVARNVVVKFYDEDNKKEVDKEISAPLTVKKEEKRNEFKEKETNTINKNSVADKKKTEITKVDQIKEKIIEPKTPNATKETKVTKKTNSNETPKSVVPKTTEVPSPIVNTQKLEEKKQESKRIDSMIGTAPRFMHRELTNTEKAKIEATKPNNIITSVTPTDSRLPILIDEERTPVINDKIYYGEGKANLDNEAKNYLTNIAVKLKENAEVKVELAVHCDMKDEASVADYICKLRIKRIVDLMINTLGVNFQQLMIRSVGVNEPVNNCKKDNTSCSELDHQMNRRTEIKYLN